MKTILAVDDSATMREMVAFVLESAGYRVIEAEDGAQGLDRASHTPVDLVITDQNMPNMDGLTLVRSLRELRDYKSVPILLLTTESSDSMKQQGRAAGATESCSVAAFGSRRLRVFSTSTIRSFR